MVFDAFLSQGAQAVFLVVLPLLVGFVFLQREKRNLDERERRLEERIERVERGVEEVRYDIPPAQRINIEGSIIAVLCGGVEAGVAFFVSPTKALTVAHNLLTSSGHHQRVAQCVRTSDGARLTFDVAHCDVALDFAVLKLRKNFPLSQHFLTIPQSIGVAPGERGVFLVTCNIRMAAEAPDVASVGVAWHQARIVKTHLHNFLYDSLPFDGDSGGAIVIAKTGAVIGLHKELVNAAREIIEHKKVGDSLNAMELSLQSLIRGNSVGCVAVRTDSEEVRKMLSD